MATRTKYPLPTRIARLVIPLLAAISLVAGQLTGIAAAHHGLPPDTNATDLWDAEDGSLDADAGNAIADMACGSGDDDKTINGDPYKIGVLHQPDTVFEVKTLGATNSDLCNIWLNTKTDTNGDVWLYLAWERFAGSGTNVVYFEFHHSPTNCDYPAETLTCNPFKARSASAGDFILAYDFQGSDPTLGTRVFNGSGFTPSSGSTPLSTDNYEAKVDWDGTQNKQQHPGEFGEAAVNLSGTGILPNANTATGCTVLANVIPMTVTGNSDSAEVIDVVLTNAFEAISNCGILTVTKVTDPTGLTGPFDVRLEGGPQSIDVTQEFAGHGSSWTYGDASNEPLFAGEYTLTEYEVPSGWRDSYSVYCDEPGDGVVDSTGTTSTGVGGITVVANETTSCTITNTAILPEIKLIKTVSPSYGGNENASAFDLKIDGTTVTQNEFHEKNPGTYTLSEAGPSGWSLDSISCDNDKGFTDEAQTLDVTLNLGDSVTCTFTNVDDAPSLTITKDVDAQYGGDETEDDFTPTLDGSNTTWGAQSGIVSNQPYTVGEATPPSGWTMTSIVCTDDDTDAVVSNPVTLNEGQSVTCDITNQEEPPKLTLVKRIVNDDGGDETEADFTPTINDVSTTWGVQSGIRSNTSYHVSELSPGSGWAMTSVVCVDDNDTADPPTDLGATVTLDEGQEVTCTITNDDVPPGLTLLKDVKNDNGGNAEPEDFTLKVGDDEYTHGDTVDVDANTNYTISENLLAGYDFVKIQCDDESSSTTNSHTVNLDEGETLICTVFNDDQAPSLTITKNVIATYGGDETQDDFTPTLDGSNTTWGAQSGIVSNQPYTVGEATPPSGWTMTSIVCTDDDTDAVVSNPVTLNEGQSVTCDITNQDVQPTLTITKNVIATYGGDETQDDFTPTLDGSNTTWGAQSGIVSNQPYTVGEATPPSGWTMTSIVCTDDDTDAVVSNPVTLNEGQSVTCDITNQDVQPTLTLLKSIIADDGGNETQADFTPTINDSNVNWGAIDGIKSNTDYVISETDLPAGWEMADITCTDDTELAEEASSVTINLDEGENVTCTITNDDVAPTITVVKSVDGGDLGPDDFGLQLDGSAVASGSTTTVSANEPHVVSELGDDGYVAMGIVCTDNDTSETVSHPVTLNEGQDVTCVVTNAVKGISIVKSAVIEANEEGLKVIEFHPEDDDEETVDYIYEITNTGRVTLTDVIIVDDVLGVITPVDTTLDPGESTTATATHTVSQADANRGDIVNVAVVTGTAPDDTQVTDTDDETVFVLEVLPAILDISLDKVALVDPDDDGDKTVKFEDGKETLVEYEYTVCNEGNAALIDITLGDDILGTVTLEDTTLAPGECTTGRAIHEVSQGDADAGKIVNVAEVNSKTEDGGPGPSARDDETVFVVEVKPKVLAKTGSDTDRLFAWAVLMLALGAAALNLGRDVRVASEHRRRRD